MARPKKKEEAKPQEGSGAAQKLQAIKLAMDQIEKQYGRGSIMRLGEKIGDRFKVDVLPTGSIALDLALGGWRATPWTHC